MRILVADKLPPFALEALGNLGVLDFQPELSKDTLPSTVETADILIVRSTEVTKTAIEAAPQLSLIIRAGAGVNTIDVAAASAHGVFVANCPGQNAIAVAELTFGLLLAIDRRIPENVIATREGRWDKKNFSEADGLAGKKLGLLGFGNIAQAVAKRALAFGMHVGVWSRSLNPLKAKEHSVEHFADVDNLLSNSDIISLHLPLNSETRSILNHKRISQLRRGSILLNTARAELVDQAALLAATSSGQIRAGLDVFSAEPGFAQGKLEHPVVSAKNVWVTHHIGASTTQAQDAVAHMTVHIVENFLRSGQVKHAVNLRERSIAKTMLVVRHADKVGVLASILAELREAGVNVQEMSNRMFDSGETATTVPAMAVQATAVANIRLLQVPNAATLAAIRQKEHIIRVEVFQDE